QRHVIRRRKLGEVLGQHRIAHPKQLAGDREFHVRHLAEQRHQLQPVRRVDERIESLNHLQARADRSAPRRCSPRSPPRPLAPPSAARPRRAARTTSAPVPPSAPAPPASPPAPQPLPARPSQPPVTNLTSLSTSSTYDLTDWKVIATFQSGKSLESLS